MSNPDYFQLLQALNRAKAQEPTEELPFTGIELEAIAEEYEKEFNRAN